MYRVVEVVPLALELLWADLQLIMYVSDPPLTESHSKETEDDVKAVSVGRLTFDGTEKITIGFNPLYRLCAVLPKFTHI